MRLLRLNRPTFFQATLLSHLLKAFHWVTPAIAFLVDFVNAFFRAFATCSSRIFRVIRPFFLQSNLKIVLNCA